MSSVYLINIGANTSHSARARSPIFADGSFVYVSFPTPTPQRCGYSREALPFLRGVPPDHTHADPCWGDFTYGDDCRNPRASILRLVEKDDILLFWGLLWKNGGRDWTGFTGERGWYLLGAFRVEEIAADGQSVQEVSEQNRTRAARNPHLRGRDHVKPGQRVFLGAPRYSRRFARAVDLGVADPSGLLYSAFTASDGNMLVHGGRPAWSSSLRSCRKMWNLSLPMDRARALRVRDAIVDATGFDLMEPL